MVTHRSTTSLSFVEPAVAEAALLQSAGLANAVLPSAAPFSTWDVVKDGATVGYLYSGEVENPYRNTFLGRLLFAPASVRVAAYVDASYGIGRVGLLTPRAPAGTPSTLEDYLNTWRERTLYQVVTADTAGPWDPAAGQYGAVIPDFMMQLAESIYLRDMGRLAYDRLIAQARSPVLQLGMLFPYFEGVTSDGQRVSLNTFKGRKTLILFTEPSCGSCYDTVMKLLNTVVENKYDLEVLTVIFGSEELGPVQRFIDEAAPSSLLIVDAEKDLARTMHQLHAPYAVILDVDQTVLYEGGAGTDSPVYRELKTLMGAEGGQ
jgi:peroxiredoxin